MSNAKRSVAQLRAEKEARHRDGLEGIRLLSVVSKGIRQYNGQGVEPSTIMMMLTTLLEKAEQSCAVLEHYPDPLFRYSAHECKARLLKDLGKTAEAMTAFHETRRVCACRHARCQ